MNAPFRVAIVGAGSIGLVHARIAVAHNGLILSAIINRSPEKAATLATLVESELGTNRPETFSNLTQALAAVDIDLVVVATPSGTHASLTEEAINAGVHVLIEKPVDVRVIGARQLQRAAAEAGPGNRVVSVVSQNRFAPAVVAVRNAIQSGRFGRVTSATATLAWWRDDDYYASGGWRGTWELDGGGALMNQGVHTVDLLLHFLGTPIEVFGYTGMLAHTGVEVEDVAAAVIRFESGAVATILATTNAFPENDTRIQVHGTSGTAFLQDGHAASPGSGTRPIAKSARRTCRAGRASSTSCQD
jgi:UDP-N-acetyl-2-amino-2-deoxyglucuronate dehydrogenase